jgi:hypothetical protein
MHDTLGKSTGNGIRGSHGAYIRRQQRAPRACDRSPQWIERMSTSIAPRARQFLRAKPTGSADDLWFACRPRCAADATCGW